MYHAIVRAQVRRAFRLLSTGEADALAAQMRPDVHHTFPGEHALGGVRRDREAVRAWLYRLHRLFPDLVFEPVSMAASGPPWATVVGVEWRNRGTLPDGSAYVNAGAHVLRLRWGRLVSFHAYLDATESARALDRLVELGVQEAGAEPITSSA
ncbi:nuclear transport factor 2 family protein [Jannaschia sp. R86511]|uniref:nuclear transport factor 2 family protein n=1 Tax=Jannaschia sp. R86511 TaxID=3093853 RepID=UPI0036D2D782